MAEETDVAVEVQTAALAALEDAARRGDVAAAYRLGRSRFDNGALPADFGVGAWWIAQAARAGLPAAQHALGLLYQTGRGVPQNYMEAGKWFRLAAEQQFGRPRPDNPAVPVVKSRLEGGGRAFELTEYRLSLPGDRLSMPFPFALAEAGDGSIWVTLQGEDAVLRLDPAGRARRFRLPRAGSGPLGICAGDDGAMWCAAHDAGTIVRIAADGSMEQVVLPDPGSYPRHLVTAHDGAIWFTQRAGGRIGRIDRDLGLTEFALPDAGSHPDFIVAGPDDALWFTQDLNGRLGRIDALGVVTQWTIGEAGSSPNGLAFAPDGALWIAERLSNCLVRLVDGQETARFQSGEGGVYGIGCAADGTVWFTKQRSNRIGFIAPDGILIEIGVPTPDSEPECLAIAADGAVWFTEYHGGSLGRIALLSS